MAVSMRDGDFENQNAALRPSHGFLLWQAA